MSENSPMFPVAEESAATGASHLQWLAGLAMQSLLIRNKGIPETDGGREEIALWSYRMAQAMQRTESLLHVNEAEIPQ